MSQPRDFGYDEETNMLKEAVLRFFEEKSPITQLRPHIEGTEDPHRGR